jgi:hypothetical protein
VLTDILKFKSTSSLKDFSFIISHTIFGIMFNVLLIPMFNTYAKI